MEYEVVDRLDSIEAESTSVALARSSRQTAGIQPDQRQPCPTTSFRTSFRCAPSARRMPISCVRCVTE